VQFAGTVPALEDKLVQLACAKLLGAIDEEDYLDCSHGYRAGCGAKDTVIELTFELMDGKYGYLVEADIRGFFTPRNPVGLPCQASQAMILLRHQEQHLQASRLEVTLCAMQSLSKNQKATSRHTCLIYLDVSQPELQSAR